MKKKRCSDGISPFLYQNFRRMKLTLGLIILTVFSTLAADLYSQNTGLSLDYQNENVLTLLRNIENQSKYRFFFNEEIDLDFKVTVNIENAQIDQILNKVFENKDINYELVGRQIILTGNESAKQQKLIKLSGKVTDITGQPLPGVTVVVKGTTNGTITNFDGIYNLREVPSGSTIQFSFVGLKMQEILVEGKTSINIVMEEDAIGIEEVVAIGYGSVRKSDLTGSVAGISADDISDAQSTDFITAMQGRLAGVNISSQSGEPGAGIDIQIRGGNSIYGSSSPLFVIDGVQIQVNEDEVASSEMSSYSNMNPLSNLNPADIESIEVLKDASATSIFGARGANGVVIVTTKSGKKGKSVIEYDGYVGVSQVSKKIDVLGAEDYLDYQRLRNNTLFLLRDSDGDGNADTERDFSRIATHDWQDEAFRTAISHNHTLNISGANEKTNYSASAGVTSQQGILENNDYDRYNMRLKLDHKHSAKWRFGAYLNGSFSEQRGVTSSGPGGGTYNGLTQLIVNSSPWEIKDPDVEQSHDFYISPMAIINDGYKSIRLARFISNLKAEYNFTKHLKFSSSIGSNFSQSKLREYYPTTTNLGDNWGGKAGVKEIATYSFNFANQLNYNKTFNKIHRLSAMVAFEMSQYNYERFENIITNFEDESTGVFDISKGSVINRYSTNEWITKQVSYLSRVNYTLNNKYLFTASIRADGSDKFGSNKHWGYFPSGAFAWRASEENFMKSFSKLNNLKLRLSYGQTGNDRIPAYSQYALMGNTYYANDDNLLFGMSPVSMESPDLKWETSIQYNAGIDIGLFKSRLNINADYYLKQTTDMLINGPVPSQSGYNSRWSNLGRIDNNGFELLISSVNIEKRDFSWESSFNISFNKNEVKNIGGADYIPVTFGGGFITSVGRVMVGEPIGIMYGYEWDGIYQIEDFTWQNESDPTIPHDERVYSIKEGVVGLTSGSPAPGKLKYKDLNDDGIVDDENDRKIIGYSSPKHVGGLNNSFRYKNFRLNFFLQWSYGNDIFNESKYRLQGGNNAFYNVTYDYFNDFWTENNPSNNYPGVALIEPTPSTYFVEDGSFLRLKTASLEYNLPKSILSTIGVSSAKFYVSGNNLYTWTNYSGYDPEVSSNNPLIRGFERTAYPRSRSIIVGVNVKF